jgi:hypothetical protein
MSTCQRCGKQTFATIMSMFSTALICPACKDAETKRSDYKKAEARDLMNYASRLAAEGMTHQANNVREQAKRLLEG